MAYTSIDDPTIYFNTVLYTGNAADGSSTTQDISGVGFQPDWVWLKGRDNANNHVVDDSVRGANKHLFPDLTNAENTSTNYIKSFASDGFQLGPDGAVNGNGNTYVAWNWLAGGTASSNTDGDITSSVSVNTTAGFSIVSYTGTGSNATVGHGLGVAPKVLILKSRTRSDGQWTVGSDMLGWSKFLFLDATSAEQTFNLYQNTAPTSSVFYLSGDGGVNQSSGSMIGYAFAEKKGYSKFGSYTGNGNADGPFVYTGFRPAWVLVKLSSGVDDWQILDNKRSPHNIVGGYLRPNSSSVTVDNDVIDFTSVGFKLRTSAGSWNPSGGTFIYMAFAEAPFVNSNGVPATAR